MSLISLQLRNAYAYYSHTIFKHLTALISMMRKIVNVEKNISQNQIIDEVYLSEEEKY
jgi:hypothetical protein